MPATDRRRVTKGQGFLTLSQCTQMSDSQLILVVASASSRQCERPEAIQIFATRGVLDCIVAYAPCNDDAGATRLLVMPVIVGLAALTAATTAAFATTATASATASA